MSRRRQDIVTIRAIAILLVMLGHSIVLYSSAWNLYSTEVASPPLDHLKDVINVVQMPLFFSVSGFCFLYSMRSTKQFGAFVLAKIRRILVPFLIIGLLWLYPLRTLIRYPGYRDHSPAYVIVKDILGGYDNGHLWFLPTLFLMLMVTDLLSRLIADSRFRDAVILAIAVIALMVVPNGVPYIREFGQYYLYFVLGILIHEHEERLRCWSPPLVAWGLALAALALLILIYSGVRNGMVLKMTALLSVVVCYRIVPNKENAVLRPVSRNSMGMYLFHSPLLYISFTYWPNINPCLMLVINFIGFGSVAYLLTNLMRKLKLGFVIGEV